MCENSQEKFAVESFFGEILVMFSTSLKKLL